MEDEEINNFLAPSILLLSVILLSQNSIYREKERLREREMHMFFPIKIL